MENGFEFVALTTGEKGLLKKVGAREVVVTVKHLPGADEADNLWLEEAIKNMYLQYYNRVKSYKEDLQ